MLFLTFAALAPDIALACACCADPGHRATYTGEVDDWHQRQMATIVFAPTVNLYSDACGNECIQGVSDPERSYDMTVSRVAGNWQIDLKHAGEDKGQLRFSMPATFEHFSTDLAPDPDAMMPAPYSEFRHEVQIKGFGSFRTKEPVSGELIFTGQSTGRCEALSTSTHWFLDVRTESVRWRLYGALIAPDP